MADKEPDFIVAMRKQQTDAQIACWWRAVDAGEFPNNEDTRAAYLAGWRGVRDFDRAKKTLNESGGASFGFGMITFLFGSLTLSIVGMGAYLGLSLRYPLWTFLLASSGFYGISYLLYRNSRKVGSKAAREFQQTWEPSSKKTSDEAKVTVDE